MAGTQVMVDVPVRLQVMQASVDEIKRILNHLEPDSSGFKKLSKTLAEMTAQMEKFQAQTSKPFGSQTQFNQASKTVEKMEESLAKAKIQIEGLKFSDIKLTKGQTDAFKQIEEDITRATEVFEKFKNQVKLDIINQNKDTFNIIDANAVDKSFEQVEKTVNNKLNSINQKVADTQRELQKITTEAATQKLASNLMGQGISRESFLGYDEWFWEKGDKRGLRVGRSKEGLLNAIADQFQFDPTSRQQFVDGLKNQTLEAISESFKQINEKDLSNPIAALANQLSNSLNKQTNAQNALTEFQDLQAKLQQIKTEFANSQGDSGALSGATQQFNTVIEQAEVRLKNLREAALQAATGNGQLQNSFNNVNSQLQIFINELQRSNAQFLQLQRSQQTFNSIKMAITNFMGFNQVLNLTKRAVQEAANHIKQLDTTMNGIAIVTDMTTADLWNQVDAYSEMAQRYGTTIQGAYEVSKIYYQAGYATNDVLTLMNETLKLSKISGLDYATTTDYMMTATRGFHMEVSEAAKVVDVYSALAANTAVSQQELAEAMTRTASSMEGVGATFEEASAMIATMVSVTRESANNIGSAMKSIASRYGELTKDPKKLFDAEGEAMSFNKVDEALKSVGISLQTTDHQFRDFTDVIMELASVWNTLDSAQQRYYLVA